jgi:hypothetical protein
MDIAIVARSEECGLGLTQKYSSWEKDERSNSAIICGYICETQRATGKTILVN